MTKLPPVFTVLRRIGTRATEIVDMYRFRKNAEERKILHRQSLKWRGLVARVWIERYEPARRKR